MRLFRIGIVVAVLLLCIPRKVHATSFENKICSFSPFQCIIQMQKDTQKFDFEERTVYGTTHICYKK